MPELHFHIFPKNQLRLWKWFETSSTVLKKFGFYLAGGTGLALQIGHRRSADFDFFSQQPSLGEKVHEWLRDSRDFVLRDLDGETLHAELQRTKVSFIGGYKYSLTEPPLTVDRIQLASITDIALMKLLAITHRATLRDYIDLAVVIRNHISLKRLLKLCRKKYGKRFNLMIPLKALVSFEDLDREMPLLFDKNLQNSWPEILRQAVKEVS